MPKSGQRACTPFRDDPEGYVLALHARIGEGKARGMDDMAV